jgi:hypothetical protein
MPEALPSTVLICPETAGASVDNLVAHCALDRRSDWAADFNRLVCSGPVERHLNDFVFLGIAIVCRL